MDGASCAVSWEAAAIPKPSTRTSKGFIATGPEGGEKVFFMMCVVSWNSE
jgi:hypothetical protein